MAELIKVLVDRSNFDEAEAGGFVDGVIRVLVNGIGMQEVLVYVELGEEKKYRRHPKDDPKTEYKLFINCCVCVADTEEDLENGNWSNVKHGPVVQIYC